MNKNPYDEFLVDEASGIQVWDTRHEVWEEGYKAGEMKEYSNIFHFEAKDVKDLRRRRLLRGLTLKQLSERSGVSASHIGRVERGERSPGSVVLTKIQRGLEGE